MCDEAGADTSLERVFAASDEASEDDEAVLSDSDAESV